MSLTAFRTLFDIKCNPVALPFFSLPKIVYISVGFSILNLNLFLFVLIFERYSMED